MELLELLNIIFMWILLLVNLLLTLALIRHVNSQSSQNPRMEGLKSSTAVPDLAIKMINGQSYQLQDFTEQELLMAFVSPTCRPCREKMPLLQDIHEAAKAAGIGLIVVSLSDMDKASEFADEVDFQIPLFIPEIDVEQFRDNYKIPGTPFYYVIDNNRKIRSGGVFDVKWEKIVSGLKSL